jgi:hypothetical protein
LEGSGQSRLESAPAGFKFFRFAIVASVLAVLCISSSSDKVTRSLTPLSAQKTKAEICPYQTPEEWQQFLERYAGNEKWVDTCEDATCDSEFFQFVKENIQETFDNCKGFIGRNPKVAACTKNLKRFTVAWMQQHDSVGYGFTVDNHTYLTSQDAPDKPPGMMKPPEAIIAALPSLSKVEKAARDEGLKYLTHDSALDGSRTFVLISDPKGRFDQWMLLNLQENQQLNDHTPLSILVVQKKDARGRKLRKIRLHFRDYTITQKKKKKGYTLSLNENANGKCYSCHPSGVRQLIARRTPILAARPVKGDPGYADSDEVSNDPPDFAYERLLEFNRRLRAYGTPDWDGMVIPEDHGPPLGKAQGCTDCHSTGTRSALNLSTSHIQLNQKLLLELSMPPDTTLPQLLEKKEMRSAELTPEEKRALGKAYSVHEDLTADFESSRLPALKGWLLETSCL